MVAAKDIHCKVASLLLLQHDAFTNAEPARLPRSVGDVGSIDKGTCHCDATAGPPPILLRLRVIPFLRDVWHILASGAVNEFLLHLRAKYQAELALAGVAA